MEKANFRILLDVSNIETRVHKFVWMLVSTVELNCVADLKDVIIKKLDLNRDIKLLMNGGLLLEEEKIIILRENDTVQVQYEKLPDSFCDNSSFMEGQNGRLSLNANADQCKEKESSNHSKKRKRRSEASELSITEENSLTQYDSSCIEVDSQSLSFNNEKGSISKRSKKKRKTKDLLIAEENQTVVECGLLPDSFMYSPVDVETENSHFDTSTGKKISKRSKKHKRRNEEDIINKAEENEEISKNKIKNNVALDNILEKIYEIQDNNSSLYNDITEGNEYSSKKQKAKKSSYSSTTKEANVALENGIKANKNLQQSFDYMLVQGSSPNTCLIEDNAIPLASDASFIDNVPEDTINLKETEDNKPTDISVDSIVQGSNCKKRKRKRKRKQKFDTKSLGNFIANTSAFQNATKEVSKPVSPCDNYSGIRKHIKFTSLDRESSSKEIEAVGIETNYSSSQTGSSPIKTGLAVSSRLPSLPENIARATEIANKASKKFCTSPNNVSILPITKTQPLTRNGIENTNGFPQNTSSKACAVQDSTNLFSTNTTLNSTVNSMETTTEQKLVQQNSWTDEWIKPVQNGNESYQISESFSKKSFKPSTPWYMDYPLIKVLPPLGTYIAFKLLELGENYSPEVSEYKEGVITSMNSYSDELEIELISAEIKPGRTGKFENLKEDEEPPEEVIGKVVASWSSLIEPRIISQRTT